MGERGIVRERRGERAVFHVAFQVRQMPVNEWRPVHTVSTMAFAALSHVIVTCTDWYIFCYANLETLYCQRTWRL